MDESMKKEVGEMVAAAIAAGLQPLAAQVGQVAEAAAKIGEIEKNQKVLADTVAGQKLLTAEAVQKMVGEQLDAANKAAAEAASKAAADKALADKRTAFAGDQLKGIPAGYHAKLGADESKWAEEAKAIREAFAAEAKAAGLTVPAVGGSAGGAAVGKGQQTAKPMGSLTAGESAFAAGIKFAQ